MRLSLPIDMGFEASSTDRLSARPHQVTYQTAFACDLSYGGPRAVTSHNAGCGSFQEAGRRRTAAI